MDNQKRGVDLCTPWSTQWVLKPRFLASPGHEQRYYWPTMCWQIIETVNIFLCSLDVSNVTRVFMQIAIQYVRYGKFVHVIWSTAQRKRAHAFHKHNMNASSETNMQPDAAQQLAPGLCLCIYIATDSKSSILCTLWIQLRPSWWTITNQICIQHLKYVTIEMNNDPHRGPKLPEVSYHRFNERKTGNA